MGGNSAWRKRVAAGELAKGSGGAALRHRPRLGRRGADLALNRLGNIGGRGNPKKLKKRAAASDDEVEVANTTSSLNPSHTTPPLFRGGLWLAAAAAAAVFALLSFLFGVRV